MAQEGLGVMINKLFGRDRGGAVLEASKGKVITSAEVSEQQLVIAFADGTKIFFRDDGQSCCESRYMRTDDNPSDFVGGVLQDVQLRDAPSQEDEYGEHEIQFLEVITSKGQFTISNHNEHNGYYGGFYLVVGRVKQ